MSCEGWTGKVGRSRAAREDARAVVKGDLDGVWRMRGREREMCRGSGTPSGSRRRLCREGAD
jgi:hypothetical protein